MARHLWLVGMMGSGKSSVGRLVAERAEIGFVDSDDIVSERIGRPIAEFWGEHGEEAFRDAESAVIEQLAQGPNRVIATGGGVILRDANVARMRDTGVVIWLQAGIETLVERVAHNNRRPLLRNGTPADKLQALLEERKGAYEEAAHGTIATDELGLDTVATRIEELWNAY